MAIAGWNACLSLFETRPQDIFRVYFSRERSSKLHHIKKWCSDRRLPYRQLTAEELSRAASSVHHEGLVMVTRPPALKSTLEYLKGTTNSDDVLVALDRISNTHNLGAILRTSSFFGVKGLVTAWDEGQAGLTPSAIRMAEGGLESVSVYECKDIASFLRDSQKSGLFVVGTETKAEHSLYEVSLKRPCILVMGNESEGLTTKVKRRCDTLVHIPGTGGVQSLNVAVATGILLTEIFRKKAKEQ